jgi:hypothetical protein
MKFFLLTAFVLSLTGCASTIPGADKAVNFTYNKNDVTACKLVGKTTENTIGTNMADDAVLSGGDTIYVYKKVIGIRWGIIYNCHGNDTRQPIPVQVPPV